MASVVRHEHESFESLFKRFRKRVQREKIRTIVRRGRFYEKPSQERKRRARKKLVKSRRTTIKDKRRRF